MSSIKHDSARSRGSTTSTVGSTARKKRGKVFVFVVLNWQAGSALSIPFVFRHHASIFCPSSPPIADHHLSRSSEPRSTVLYSSATRSSKILHQIVMITLVQKSSIVHTVVITHTRSGARTMTAKRHSHQSRILLIISNSTGLAKLTHTRRELQTKDT
ncbi:hypothetical protein PGT21_001740 [Puccinia graminis f. sp. tritici]|uniref:Uncharacterized protein n=1 Tax=Puccinia graminis f. sp. tritici TaxID=56615 RepID=A0A5B0NJK7_PUCGR|nr:hypothetical protein PGT21_001740 [Puccinia graminis f. sp. tritici]